MYYSANGNMNIKEGLDDTPSIEDVIDQLKDALNKNISAKNLIMTNEQINITPKDDKLGMQFYDKTGNLKAGSKISDKGDYQIWTGYCYDENCSSVLGNEDPGLSIDKDGTATLKKLCVKDVCLSRNEIKIFKSLVNGIVQNFNYKKYNVEDYKDVPIGQVSDNVINKIVQSIQQAEQDPETLELIENQSGQN